MASSIYKSVGGQVNVLLVLVLFIGSCHAQLSTSFYNSSCPNLLTTVATQVQTAITNEARMGASLLRLHFHDCFVNGCDASILLDDTSNFTGEQNALPNANSIRGLDVINTVKTAVDAACGTGIVSCADILTLAARDSVSILGGPSWNVKLGRRDSLTANQTGANSNLPAPILNLTQLIANFANVNLDITDLVALSGAHTIGQARCTTFRGRIYNDTNINATFAQSLQSNCPSTANSGDNNLAPLDLQTQNIFDNAYFSNLLSNSGLLHSDQELFNGGAADAIVQSYVNNTATFSSDFVIAMIKMGDISPLTGTSGEIRNNCSKTN